MKTSMRIMGLGLLALLASCSKNSVPTGGFQRPPTPVETAVAETGPVTDSFSTVGSLEANEAITVASEIDGIVLEVPFMEGSRLEKDAMILRLDDRQLQAETDRALALKDQRMAVWKRVKTVVDKGAGAPQDLDDAVAALKVAEADLALARTRLDKAWITAPFTGMVGARQVSPGAFLRAGQAITDLAQVDTLRVTFGVPERLLESIAVGAPVSVTTTAFPEAKLTGTIDVISPQLDPQTRSVSVVARLANADGLLHPGMSATISVILDQRQGAVTVPSEAVFVEGNQAFVYSIKPDSVVTRTAVELGSRQRGRVEITAGLASGQQIVTAGYQKLYEGAKVAPVGDQGPGQESGQTR